MRNGTWMSRRGLARVLVFALATLIAGAGKAPGAEISPETVTAAQREGRVVLYSPLIVEQIVRPLAAAFEARYRIRVDYLRMDSSQVVLKLLNEHRARRVVADVITTSLGIETLIAAGALRPFEVAGAEALPPEYRDPDRHWAATRLYVVEPVVNTRLVPESDHPKSYEDLLDPKWAGRFVLRDSNLTGATGFVGGILMGMGEEQGMEFLRRLARQRITILRVSDRAVLDQIIAGEYALGLAMTNHNVEISRKEGAPVAWLPLDPAVIFSEQMGLTRNGPHPNAALLFADFVLSREGQEVFRRAGYIPARPDVPPLDPALLPSGGKFRATIATPEIVRQNRERWDRIYRELFR